MSDKVGKKGVLLARRDNSAFIRQVYKEAVEMTFARYKKHLLHFMFVLGSVAPLSIGLFLIASLYMSSLCSLTRSHSFANFVNNYNKRYDSTAEYFKRKSIFERNHLLIESHNRANKNWKLRMNTFGDLYRLVSLQFF